MILQIKVVPKSSRKEVKKEGEGLKVYLTKPAVDGLANEQLKEMLSDYLHVKKYHIDIIKGEHSRNKVVQIREGCC